MYRKFIMSFRNARVLIIGRTLDEHVRYTTEVQRVPVPMRMNRRLLNAHTIEMVFFDLYPLGFAYVPPIITETAGGIALTMRGVQGSVGEDTTRLAGKFDIIVVDHSVMKFIDANDFGTFVSRHISAHGEVFFQDARLNFKLGKPLNLSAGASDFITLTVDSTRIQRFSRFTILVSPRNTVSDVRAALTLENEPLATLIGTYYKLWLTHVDGSKVGLQMQPLSNERTLESLGIKSHATVSAWNNELSPGPSYETIKEHLENDDLHCNILENYTRYPLPHPAIGPAKPEYFHCTSQPLL